MGCLKTELPQWTDVSGWRKFFGIVLKSKNKVSYLLLNSSIVDDSRCIKLSEVDPLTTVGEQRKNRIFLPTPLYWTRFRPVSMEMAKNEICKTAGLTKWIKLQTADCGYWLIIVDRTIIK